MLDIYTIVGIVSFWLMFFISFFKFVGWCVKVIVDIVGRYSKSAWLIVDYMANKEKFKKWKKNEE